MCVSLLGVGLGDRPPLLICPRLWNHPSQTLGAREVCDRAVTARALRTLPQEQVERRPVRCLAVELTAVRKCGPAVGTRLAVERIEFGHGREYCVWATSPGGPVYEAVDRNMEVAAGSADNCRNARTHLAAVGYRCQPISP